MDTDTAWWDLCRASTPSFHAGRERYAPKPNQKGGNFTVFHSPIEAPARLVRDIRTLIWIIRRPVNYSGKNRGMMGHRAAPWGYLCVEHRWYRAHPYFRNLRFFSDMWVFIGSSFFGKALCLIEFAFGGLLAGLFERGVFFGSEPFHPPFLPAV